MTPKERTAMQQALDTILNSIPHYPDEADEAITALREALEVTEASISDHKFEITEARAVIAADRKLNK